MAAGAVERHALGSMTEVRRLSTVARNAKRGRTGRFNALEAVEEHGTRIKTSVRSQAAGRRITAPSASCPANHLSER